MQISAKVIRRHNEPVMLFKVDILRPSFFAIVTDRNILRLISKKCTLVLESPFVPMQPAGGGVSC